MRQTIDKTCEGNLIIEPHPVGTFQVFHDSDDCTVPHGIFETVELAEAQIAQLEIAAK